jgi:hypothetical protein
MERRGEKGKIRRGPKIFFVIGDVVCNLPNSKLHYLTLHFTSNYMSQTTLTILKLNRWFFLWKSDNTPMGKLLKLETLKTSKLVFHPHCFKSHRH